MRGYREFMRATAKAEKETKRTIHTRLREAGDIVRQDAARRFERYDEKSASGFRIRSRVGGVFVEQKLRKTTGYHPEYGALQMRTALLPALDAKSGEVERRMDQALKDLADIF
jgi:proline dehydrogenase